MNKSKLGVLAMAAVAIALLGVAGASGAGAKPAQTRLTIQASPGGLFGYVKSADPERCAKNRQVVVFQQLGDGRDRGSDKRIAVDRSGDSEASYQWSVRTGRKGRFYAEAERKAGCRAALSRTTRSLATGEGPGAGERTDYPPCGPYVSEGTTYICKFDGMHLELEQEGAFNPCRFGSGSGDCPGIATRGLFPWGRTSFGFRPKVKIFWNWNGSSRNLTFVAYHPDQGNTGVAHLGGTVPNAGSARFTITDGFAQNDSGYPNGDHFFTPDLPGQGPGEPGGPLAINFQNGSGTDFGAQVDIWGYLYLKR